MSLLGFLGGTFSGFYQGITWVGVAFRVLQRVSGIIWVGVPFQIPQRGL